jgi:hypothetical protein
MTPLVRRSRAGNMAGKLHRFLTRRPRLEFFLDITVYALCIPWAGALTGDVITGLYWFAGFEVIAIIITVT